MALNETGINEKLLFIYNSWLFAFGMFAYRQVMTNVIVTTAYLIILNWGDKEPSLINILLGRVLYYKRDRLNFHSLNNDVMTK